MSGVLTNQAPSIYSRLVEKTRTGNTAIFHFKRKSLGVFLFPEPFSFGIRVSFHFWKEHWIMIFNFPFLQLAVEVES